MSERGKSSARRWRPTRPRWKRFVRYCLGSIGVIWEMMLISWGALAQVGDARLQQDEIIVDQFITPWQTTLSSSIALANKARANVKAARLELDTARAA
jgi:hypothetical protein